MLCSGASSCRQKVIHTSRSGAPPPHIQQRTGTIKSSRCSSVSEQSSVPLTYSFIRKKPSNPPGSPCVDLLTKTGGAERSTVDVLFSQHHQPQSSLRSLELSSISPQV